MTVRCGTTPDGHFTGGIVLSEHTADEGATIFQQACRTGLEGIVTKRLSVPDWIKSRNSRP